MFWPRVSPRCFQQRWKLTRFRRGVVKRARAYSVAPAGLSRWQQWDLWRPTWRTSTLALIRFEPKLFLNDYRSMLTSPSPSHLPPPRFFPTLSSPLFTDIRHSGLPIPRENYFVSFTNPPLSVDKTLQISRELRALARESRKRKEFCALVRHYAVYNTINRALLLDIARPRLQQVV